MSRPISESLSLLSETLGNCKTNLKEKEVSDVDNIKISDVDEKIKEIQAGGGGSVNLVYAKKDKLKSFFESNKSKINKCYFTNEKAPQDVETTDISMRKANSVVCWIKDDSVYISSQSDAKICLDDLTAFTSDEYLGGGAYLSNNYFSEIYFDNLSIQINASIQHFIKDEGSKLKIIDISNLEFNPDITDSKYFDYFFSSSTLETIYSYPWQFETSDRIFGNCNKLPNWDESQTGIEMCKFKEDGGYFTNPSERVK